jgi:hypothetical protein
MTAPRSFLTSPFPLLSTVMAVRILTKTSCLFHASDDVTTISTLYSSLFRRFYNVVAHSSIASLSSSHRWNVSMRSENLSSSRRSCKKASFHSSQATLDNANGECVIASTEYDVDGPSIGTSPNLPGESSLIGVTAREGNGALITGSSSKAWALRPQPEHYSTTGTV